MKKKIFTVATATMLMSFGLQAQNNGNVGLSFKDDGGGYLKDNRKTEFFDGLNYQKVGISEELQIKSNNVTFEKLFSDKTRINTDSYFNHNENQQKIRLADYSVKKSSRDDVATITFKVVGNPLISYGLYNGYHMLIDTDHLLCDKIFKQLYNTWDKLYQDCDYKIPENASSNLYNPNGLLDDEVSIDIPGGIYDLIIINPAPENGVVYICELVINDKLYDAYLDNFEFKDGYEYIFYIEYLHYTYIYPDYDISLYGFFLPSGPKLTNQERVRVFLQNTGIQDISGEVELKYRINKGNWTEPEVLNIENLSAGDIISYSFNTFADFSITGIYEVEMSFNYNMDLLTMNNSNIGVTKKTGVMNLPFVENFDHRFCFDMNWTVINAKPEEYWEIYNWKYCDWNPDADDGQGCLQIVCPNGRDYLDLPIIPADDYIISDPINFPEQGTYNISFWCLAGLGELEKLRILYGSSSNYEEMTELADYTIPRTGHLFNMYFENFEIEIPGIYYFAFHYYSNANDGGNFIELDKIKIAQGEFVGVPDIMINRVLTPASSCTLSQGEIGAEVYNKGTAPISEFTLTYQVDGNTPRTQTFNETIGIRETKTVYFRLEVDFSEVKDYIVKLSASTPNEENTDNNEMEVVVKHFFPVTELPYNSNFLLDFSDWSPAETDGWTINWNGCYAPNYYNLNVPLLSRCFYLEPDIYRLRFNYNAGLIYGSDDFYVTYGKSGTNPYEWEPVKEFLNCSTDDYYLVIEEEFVVIEITEAGEYVFAFVATRYDGNLGIFEVTVEKAPDHDFNLKKVERSGLARLTPAYQLEGEKTFTAVLENKGKANESGDIKLLLNNNEITSENFIFSEAGQTLNIELTHVFEKPEKESLLFKFIASNNNGLSFETEILTIVSDSTYAWDNIDGNFFDGLGINGSSGKFGLIYELQKGDVVTSITVGLIEIEFTGNLGLAIYEVNDKLELGKNIFEAEYPRTNGSYEKGITFDIPDTYLKPGKYYFEVRQLSYLNIGIAYDEDPDGYFYDNNFNSGFLEVIKGMGFGFIHIRPNFGFNGSGISTKSMSLTQLTLYPNPARDELRVDNGELEMENIIIYNAMGQVVLSVLNINSTSYRLNTEKLTSGIYFISVQTKTSIVNSKFVIK